MPGSGTGTATVEPTCSLADIAEGMAAAADGDDPTPNVNVPPESMVREEPSGMAVELPTCRIPAWTSVPPV